MRFGAKVPENLEEILSKDEVEEVRRYEKDVKAFRKCIQW